MSNSQNQEQTKSQQNDVFKVYQTYFEEQQKLILNYWTQVFNSMWGQNK